jgi:hypothetical protein
MYEKDDQAGYEGEKNTPRQNHGDADEKQDEARIVRAGVSTRQIA